jgi:hypothetical protein
MHSSLKDRCRFSKIRTSISYGSFFILGGVFLKKNKKDGLKNEIRKVFSDSPFIVL